MFVGEPEAVHGHSLYFLVRQVRRKDNGVPAGLVHVVGGDNACEQLAEQLRFLRVAFEIYNVPALVLHQQRKPLPAEGVPR